MHFRSKAPLRLGLAGGGTDVDPYASTFGGAVLNATINLFAHATIDLLPEPIITFTDLATSNTTQFTWQEQLPTDGPFSLIAGVYNKMQQRFGLPKHGFALSTSVDVPIGSGLGTSSTLVVAIIGVFAEMMQLQLTPMQVAKMAYDIERKDLGFSGGHQDQYAAALGGFNYFEFGPAEKVHAQPLDLQPGVMHEFENNMVLYFTGKARQSGEIITAQQHNVKTGAAQSIEAMHQLKKQAEAMKQTLLSGELDAIGPIIDFGFKHKRLMARGISNPHIEALYNAAMKAGATGGKISGAGGGGFMFFYCPGNARFSVIETLNSFGGQIYHFTFTQQGLTTWRI